MKRPGLARHKYIQPGGLGYHNAMRCDEEMGLVVVFVVDLHRTASVAGSLDVAGAVAAAGGERAWARRLAGWRGADGGALD